VLAALLIEPVEPAEPAVLGAPLVALGRLRGDPPRCCLACMLGPGVVPLIIIAAKAALRDAHSCAGGVSRTAGFAAAFA